MNIRDLLSPARVTFDLKSNSKEEAIDELIDILDRDGKLYDRALFKKAVMDREAVFSTGVGLGIAIPHGKDKSVKEPAVTFGLSKQGVDFKASDGTLAHLLFLISVPEDSDDMHLKVLVTISRKLMHEDVRNKLLKSKSYESVLEAFGD